MVPNALESGAGTTTRRVFLAGSVAGFGLWLVSGTRTPVHAATPPLQALDVPLWRSLAFTTHGGPMSVQLRTSTADRGMLVYGVDAPGAKALARFPTADRMSIGKRVTGEAVFTQLVASGTAGGSESERLRFQQFLTASVTLGVLMAGDSTQRVMTRESGATS